MNCKTVSCKVTGYRKQIEGKECEDAYKVLRMKNAVIVAVADGHGDRRCVFARLGASIAVKAACETLREFEWKRRALSEGDYWNRNRRQIARRLTQRFALAVLDDYRRRVPQKLTRDGQAELAEYIGKAYEAGEPCSPDVIRSRYLHKKRMSERLEEILYLYGTTLRASVVGENYIFSLAIGDGDSVAVTDNGVEWLLPASEAFGCETASMCMGLDRAPEEFYFSYTEIKKESSSRGLTDVACGVSAVILSTDGLRNSFLGDKPFCDKLAEIEREIRERGSKSVSRRLRPLFERLTRNSVFQDDVTAVIVVV